MPKASRKSSLAIFVTTFLTLVIGLVLCAATPAQADEVDMDEVDAQALRTLAVTGHRIVKCDLGQYCSAAITSEGELYMWGDNNFGQLGDGTTVDAVTPKLVKGLPKVDDVSIGKMHCGAVTRDGDLYTWGENDFGQLGDGTTNDSKVPKLVEGLPPIADFAASKCGGSWVEGYAHGFSAAITVDGELYTWGENYFGQLGDGSTTDRHRPGKVEGLSGLKTVSLAAETAAVINSDGELYMWGENYRGQLGDGSGQHQYRPTKVSGIPPMKAVSIGYMHTVALSTDGGVYTWGSSNAGQLGTGDGYLSKPKRMSSVPSAVMVSAGNDYTGAVTADGRLYMWGQNDFGQIGDGHWLMNDPLGDYRRYDSPHLIDGLFDIVDISLGWQTSAAIDANGNLYEWGYGLVGDGTDQALTPTPIFHAPQKYPDPDPEPLADTVTVYRLYNHWTGEHLFTTNKQEYDDRAKDGWTPEKIAWYSPASASAGDPVYRIYNHWSGDHYYTADHAEAEQRVGEGWQWDNDGVPIFYSVDPDAAEGAAYPIYQLYNEYATVGTHHWTTKEGEYEDCKRQGWTGEDVKFYASALPPETEE